MTLVKFNNGHRNAVNPFFSDVFQSLLNDSPISDRLINKTPAVNIAETENQFEIELAAPGLSKEDFKINLDKNVLSVSAEKKVENVEEGKKYSKKEYAYNSFVRSFTLPESADQSKIEAEYVDGILKLNVAKKEEAKIQAREIAVK
ncbi:Hsp20/alpha crystallin family protein [Mucilaginibacter jinjuensis]|uniref:Hsp20/alpha crystallin family protein n=1 Tax=Mucilaginibacter jinjuensis TaxID=1176721 RepID=A0ABY7TFJ2_9SPHI|nr:Hsp20/alpha crystallin family protein [Mucilaginibacter jinjuensis]WCT15004.1 Hsp20/alpha crystallin family protein [Mucilaginibacter jinjuensis]